MKFTFLFLILSYMLQAEAPESKKHMMDFWIGDWNASWQDSIQGSNHIAKVLGDHVVEENFKLNDGSFIGKSWSLLDSVSGEWKQTWVDNSSTYLVFKGRKEADTVIFEEIESVTKNGQKHYRRMIFYSIKNESFEWDWQSSTDRISWKSVWHILYTRKK
ncbi:MAG: hypothetical protein IPF81_01820 [Bacteroidetes bacterium]|nr:hypothetical protein [Bacteroidota bacterium]